MSTISDSRQLSINAPLFEPGRGFHIIKRYPMYRNVRTNDCFAHNGCRCVGYRFKGSPWERTCCKRVLCAGRGKMVYKTVNPRYLN